MYSKILKAVTSITTDSEKNLLNFIDSLDYIDKLIIISKVIGDVVPLERVSFSPTFTGKTLMSKDEFDLSEYNDDMKMFKCESQLFLEDTIITKIQEHKDVKDASVEGESLKIIIK